MPTEIEIIIARITKKLTEAKIAYENAREKLDEVIGEVKKSVDDAKGR